MKASKYPLFTQKNIPSDAEIISHKLMLKAGLEHWRYDKATICRESFEL